MPVTVRPPTPNAAPFRISVKPESDLPSKYVALLLNLVSGCVGHFYLGFPRRAFLWHAVMLGAPFFLMLLVPSLGRVAGFGFAFGLPFVVLTTAWLVSQVAIGGTDRESTQKVPLWQTLLFWLFVVLTWSLVGPVLRRVSLEAYRVPSESMEPNLVAGDHMQVQRRAFSGGEPKRGDMITFPSPENGEQDYVKRVIALPGDKLEMRNGRPWINGWEVPTCLIGPARLDVEDPIVHWGKKRNVQVVLEMLDDASYLVLYDDESHAAMGGTWRAKGGEVLVLGDNRDNSHDSRMWFAGKGGGVPIETILGRPLFVWYTTSSHGGSFARYGQSLTTPQLPAAMSYLKDALAACMSKRPARTTPPAPN